MRKHRKEQMEEELFIEPVSAEETMWPVDARIICVDCKGECASAAKRKPLRCKLCGEVVTSYNHLREQHPFTPAEAWVVGCSVLAKQKYRFYIGEKVRSDSGYLYKCLECESMSTEQSELLKHCRENHASNKITEIPTRRPPVDHFKLCTTCDAVIKVQGGDNRFFRDHVQFCAKGELFSCNKCHVDVGCSQRLIKHNSLMHRDKYTGPGESVLLEYASPRIIIPEGTILKCAECQFTTCSYKELKDHNTRLHGYNQFHVKQICRFCFKVFKIRTEKERHIQKEHLNGERVLCPDCGADFEIPQQLSRHIYYHHAGGRDVVMKNRRRMRSQSINAICHHCGKTCKNGYDLNVHVRLVHENSQEFRCKKCHRKLNSKTSLQIHMNRHRNFKPFQCAHCPYRDYTGYQVNKHCKASHPHLLHTKQYMSFKVSFSGQAVKEELEEGEIQALHQVESPLEEEEVVTRSDQSEELANTSLSSIMQEITEGQHGLQVVEKVSSTKPVVVEVAGSEKQDTLVQQHAVELIPYSLQGNGEVLVYYAPEGGTGLSEEEEDTAVYQYVINQ